MEDYLRVATHYNEQVLQLNATVVAAIRTDPVLGPLVADYKSMKGGPLLYPYEFVAKVQRFRKLLADWEKRIPASDDDISVETEGPNWNRVELKIPGKRLYSDPTNATSTFERVHASVLTTEAAKELISARKSMEEAAGHLRDALKVKLRD